MCRTLGERQSGWAPKLRPSPDTFRLSVTFIKLQRV